MTDHISTSKVMNWLVGFCMSCITIFAGIGTTIAFNMSKDIESVRLDITAIKTARHLEGASFQELKERVKIIESATFQYEKEVEKVRLLCARWRHDLELKISGSK